MELKKHLGELLVEAGIITTLTLQRALEKQKQQQGMLGEVLESMGVITDEELVVALSQQFDFKRVEKIVNHHFAKSLLEMVPGELAIQKLVFPIRSDERQLFLASNNPFDLETFDLLGKRNNRIVTPVLASRHDLMEAIKLHYQTSAPVRDSIKTVVVVDDDLMDLQAVELALIAEQIRVKSVIEPVQAMPLILETMPDLVICDSIMPHIDGFGLLRKLRGDQRTSRIPVIMLTSQESGEDEKRAIESGCIDIIPKPLRPLRIIARTKRALALSAYLDLHGIGSGW